MLKRLFVALLAMLSATVFAAVDANKATPDELDTVKGIGPVLAGKIVDARKAGSFKDWQDMITRVNGIGETNAAKFSTAGLTVNGSAFAGAAPASKPDAKPATKPAEAAKPVATPPATPAPAAAAKTAAAPAPAAAPTTSTAASAPAKKTKAQKKAEAAASAASAASAAKK